MAAAAAAGRSGEDGVASSSYTSSSSASSGAPVAWRGEALVVSPFETAWVTDPELLLPPLVPPGRGGGGAGGGGWALVVRARAPNDATVVLSPAAHPKLAHYRRPAPPPGAVTVILGSHANTAVVLEWDGELAARVTLTPSARLAGSVGEFRSYWIAYDSVRVLRVGYGEVPSAEKTLLMWQHPQDAPTLRCLGLSSWDRYVAYQRPRLLPPPRNTLFAPPHALESSQCCSPSLEMTWRDEGDCLVEAGHRLMRAHRHVLAHASPVFRRMFFHGMTESSSGKLVVKEFGGCSKAVTSLVRYAYTHSLPAEPASLRHDLTLLILADRYGMEALCHLVEARLVRNPDLPQVACAALSLGDALGADALAEAAASEAAKRLAQLPDQHAKHLCALSADQLVHVLTHKDLRVDKEEEALRAIACWLANERVELESLPNKLVIAPARDAHAARLLQLVQWGRLPEHLRVADCATEDASCCVIEGARLVSRFPWFVPRSACGSDVGVRRPHACVYEADGDTNGACYWIGTGCGTRAWAHPVVTGAIVAAASSPVGRETDARALVGRRYRHINHAVGARAWWALDLGLKHALTLAHYTLRTDSSTEFAHSWTLQASYDGHTWLDLRHHEQDRALCRPAAYATWVVNHPVDSPPFRHFRVVSHDDKPNARFPLAHFELYGALH
eukprot:jgi/Chlat1/1137/Chrsp112S01615